MVRRPSERRTELSCSGTMPRCSAAPTIAKRPRSTVLGPDFDRRRPRVLLDWPGGHAQLERANLARYPAPAILVGGMWRKGP